VALNSRRRNPFPRGSGYRPAARDKNSLCPSLPPTLLTSGDSVISDSVCALIRAPCDRFHPGSGGAAGFPRNFTAIIPSMGLDEMQLRETVLPRFRKKGRECCRSDRSRTLLPRIRRDRESLSSVYPASNPKSVLSTLKRNAQRDANATRRLNPFGRFRGLVTQFREIVMPEHLSLSYNSNYALIEPFSCDRPTNPGRLIQRCVRYARVCARDESARERAVQSRKFPIVPGKARSTSPLLAD